MTRRPESGLLTGAFIQTDRQYQQLQYYKLCSIYLFVDIFIYLSTVVVGLGNGGESGGEAHGGEVGAAVRRADQSGVSIVAIHQSQLTWPRYSSSGPIRGEYRGHVTRLTWRTPTRRTCRAWSPGRGSCCARAWTCPARGACRCARGSCRPPRPRAAGLCSRTRCGAASRQWRTWIYNN